MPSTHIKSWLWPQVSEIPPLVGEEKGIPRTLWPALLVETRFQFSKPPEAIRQGATGDHTEVLFGLWMLVHRCVHLHTHVCTTYIEHTHTPYPWSTHTFSHHGSIEKPLPCLREASYTLIGLSWWQWPCPHEYISAAASVMGSTVCKLAFRIGENVLQALHLSWIQPWL